LDLLYRLRFLYAGEQSENDAQGYYLRTLYYDPLNGRFNRTDPFAGSLQDPQSLHKYLYAHDNPINNTDPTASIFRRSMKLWPANGSACCLGFSGVGQEIGAGLPKTDERTIITIQQGF